MRETGTTELWTKEHRDFRFRRLGVKVAVFLVIIGFLYAIFDPLQNGRSLVHVVALGAGVAGIAGGLGSDLSDSMLDSWIGALIYLWMLGCMAVGFAIVFVSIGWFSGVLTCFNIVPRVGLEGCVP